MIAFLFTIPLLAWAYFQPQPATSTYLSLASLPELFIYATRHGFPIPRSRTQRRPPFSGTRSS